jgi:hypothetical protein
MKMTINNMNRQAGTLKKKATEYDKKALKVYADPVRLRRPLRATTAHEPYPNSLPFPPDEF